MPERTAPAAEPAGTTPAAPVEPVDESAARRAGARARARYAGFDWIASFLGFTTALFFIGVFGGIVAAIVAFDALSQVSRVASGSLPAMSSTPVILALVGGGVATLLAYFIGGYAAGRLARYDGLLNGLGVVLWTILIAVAVAIAGAVLSRFQAAPTPHLGGAGSGGVMFLGVVSGVVVLILMIIGAALGGVLGAHYHRRVDRAIGVIA